MKRQQSQTQSQGGQGGNQIQNQSQNAPGGQQHQTQTQGHLEPIATPAVNHQDNRNQGSLVPQGNDQQYPQGNQGNSYPQGNDNRNQQNYPQTDGRNPQQQGNYQQPQANYQPGFAPFGFGAFGPQG